MAKKTRSHIEENWLDQDEETEEYSLTEYDITASPNDFNILTIFNFIESGAVKIPAFQRHYVWDIRRASKLIESLVMGIPIPQVFLYEESRNKFLVVDGQQRLMSIYYFIKERFPKKEKRADLRLIFDRNSQIPPETLKNDEYFEPFELQLPKNADGASSALEGLTYSTLEDHRTAFELRTVRNIIVKQNTPKDDDSSIYEIFNRLNSGGVNLAPQEIRASLYHSSFYEMLYRINADPRWRELLGRPEPDIRMKDIEVLLRGFAMLMHGTGYKPSMAQFLNHFSKQVKSNPPKIINLEKLFDQFLEVFSKLNKPFYGKDTGRFNISTFEATFAAVAQEGYKSRTAKIAPVTNKKMNSLKTDKTFTEATTSRTSAQKNVQTRLRRAREILLRNRK